VDFRRFPSFGAEMSNGQETESATKRKQAPWTPPRGILYKFAQNRPKPFLLRWRDETLGRVRTVSYANETDRENAAKALAEKRAEHGRSITSFDPVAWMEYLEAKVAAKGADLRIVVHEWSTQRGGPTARTNAHSPSVTDAVDSYLKLRLSEDVKEETDTWRHFDLHLRKRFAAQFSSMSLHEVTADMIRSWMHKLKDPKTGTSFSNLTKRHHRKDVNTFFKRAVAEGWIAVNPCEIVKPPSHDEDTSDAAGRVIPAEDLVRLFAANRDQPVIGRMALELFGLLRCSSVERIRKDHVNFEEKGIAMPGQRHKSGKRKYRSGHPDNLWAWLKHAGDAMWSEVTEGNYDKLKGDAFIRAGVTNPGNGLRHSAVSYHMAAFKNPGLTQYLAQHRHSSTTEGYEGLATDAGAKVWLSILP
jgi:site-specific recombinase XerC